ncbi:DUF3800 domain-containing protein [Leucobacter luti]|uniref:DUF3800 domain-containing protein n=1 Tax=Leucobacter luti TaxID=340320 RepID=UPI003D04C651
MNNRRGQRQDGKPEAKRRKSELRPRKPHAYTGHGSSSSADHAPSPEGDLGSPSAFRQLPDGMLIAYLDEFGHVGPFMGTGHKKFFHNPVFGYAGILIPAENVRRFGAKFERLKEREFRNEIHDSGKHPRRWEKKGSEIFTSGSFARYPHRVALISDLGDYLHRLGGNYFYSGTVKPIGTTKMTGQTPAELTSKVLVDVVKQLCIYAERKGRNLTVLLDQGGPMPREDAITHMASFIYSAKEPEMKRIIEVPMQLESHRYGAMQYADWLCAITSRTVHYHFTDSDEFAWAPGAFKDIFHSWATAESRILVPETHSSVRTGTLIHPKKWINSNFNTQVRPAGASLQHRVGDALNLHAQQ